MLMAGLVLLTSAAFLLYGAYGELKMRNVEVQRASTALLRIDEINSLVIGVDYSARGYALTGQRLFVDHENQKQARLKTAVGELAGIIEPDQRTGVAKLVELVGRHAEIYARFVAMGPGRSKEMAAIITDPVLRQKRYDVLNVLDRLHEAQLSALFAHQSAAENQLRYAALLTLGIVVLAFLGGIADLVVKVFGTRRKTPAAA